MATGTLANVSPTLSSLVTSDCRLSMTSRLALQLGDVAGVGADLRTALVAHTSWDVAVVPTSQLGASQGGWARQALLPIRPGLTAWNLRQTVRRVQPALTHLHGARWAPMIERIPGTPLVVHAHGTDVRGRGASRTGRVVSKALERADLVIAATPDLIEHLPSGARFLPNPVDTETFAPPATRDPEAKVVLVFSRLSAIKGAQRMVEAIPLIKERSGARVVGFAGGEFTDAAVAAGLEPLPATDRAGIVKLLHQASVVIGQQRLGALGRSETEAMSCGCPVVTDLPSKGNLSIEAGAPVAKSSTAAELADSTVALLASAAERTRLGDAGRRYVEEHHRFETVATTLASWYDEVR